jgi:hypothetical protein
MSPICTSSGFTFDASVDTTCEVGMPCRDNAYGCLGSQPNPAWYYLRIAVPGQITTLLSGSADLDFAVWGPFGDVSTAIGNCGALTAPMDCRYPHHPRSSNSRFNKAHPERQRWLAAWTVPPLVLQKLGPGRPSRRLLMLLA